MGKLPTRKRKREEEEEEFVETEDDSTGGDAMSPMLPGGIKTALPNGYGEQNHPQTMGESIEGPKVVGQRIIVIKGPRSGQYGIISSTRSEDRNKPYRLRLDEDDLGRYDTNFVCSEDEIRVVDRTSERRSDSIEIAMAIADKYGIDASPVAIQLTGREIHEWADDNGVEDILSDSIIPALFMDVLDETNIQVTGDSDIIEMAEDYL